MYGLFCKLCSLTLLLFIFCANAEDANVDAGPKHGKVVMCYIASWSIYRIGKGIFDIENVDPTLCTHVVYAYVGIDPAIDKVIPTHDEDEDVLGSEYSRFLKLKTLKEKYPHLKILVALGGYAEGSVNYSEIASDPTRRATVVNSAVQFLSTHNFDGLDFAWEFPGYRGGEAEDKENFAEWIKEMRIAFDKNNYTLTAMLSNKRQVIDAGYDLPKLQEHLHYINLRTWDYHGFWDHKSGHNAPLYSTDSDNVASTVNYYIEKGVDPSKIVLGMPTFARTYILKAPFPVEENVTTLGQPAKGSAFQGRYTESTREGGFMSYFEVCEELRKPGWNKFWDTASQAPFAANKKKLIAFDDERSLSEKVYFALKKKLAGVVVFSLDTDDFRGICFKNQNLISIETKKKKYPLLEAINIALKNKAA